MRTLEQILVPVDYSDTSDGALVMASELARAFHGRLLILHLLPFDVYGATELPMVLPGQATVGDEFRLEEENARLERHARKVLEASGRPAPAFEVAVDWGSPYHQIVEYAIERRVDLIVMGTHGRRGIRHALLGSVAEKTVRLAPCPVLTVRPHAAESLTLPEARADRREPHASGGVGRLMCKAPVTVGPDDMLSDAHARMVHAGVRHLPVVEGTRLVGILSDRDLPAHVGQLARTRVHVAMTPNPATVAPDVSVEIAARLMLDRGVRALPVVEGERVIGVLSASDILEDYVRAARA
jgi:nucleotide-binding universal stress UspA family protein